MRNFICMLCGIALAGLLLGSLNACSSPAEENTGVAQENRAPYGGSEEFMQSDVSASSLPEGNPAAAQENPTSYAGSEDFIQSNVSASSSSLPGGNAAAQGDDVPYGVPAGFIKNDVPASLAQAIEAYCRTGVLPDGQEGGEIPSRIFYAVYDVDSDGKDELILQNTATAVAGMTERVYDFDEASGTFREEFSEFPALTYYDNGIVQAEWSHNQGRAGERLWPYTLYQYQAGSDSYKELGSVDAWDRELGDYMYDIGGYFPEETDVDGDGYVYFLLPPNWEGQYTRGGIVDGADYEAWRGQYLEGARPLKVPYQELVVETIFPNAAG